MRLGDEFECPDELGVMGVKIYEIAGSEYVDAAEAQAEIDALKAELERIQTAAKRYETLRTLNPREFADLTAKNLQTGTPFDDLVDELARGGQV